MVMKQIEFISYADFKDKLYPRKTTAKSSDEIEEEINRVFGLEK